MIYIYICYLIAYVRCFLKIWKAFEHQIHDWDFTNYDEAINKADAIKFKKMLESGTPADQIRSLIKNLRRSQNQLVLHTYNNHTNIYVLHIMNVICIKYCFINIYIYI